MIYLDFLQKSLWRTFQKYVTWKNEDQDYDIKFQYQTAKFQLLRKIIKMNI